MYYTIIETMKIVSDVLNMKYNYENNKKIDNYIQEDMTLDIGYYSLDDIIHICKGLVDENTSQESLNNIKDLENNYVELNSDDSIYGLSEIHNL